MDPMAITVTGEEPEIAAKIPQASKTARHSSEQRPGELDEPFRHGTLGHQVASEHEERDGEQLLFLGGLEHVDDHVVRGLLLDQDPAGESPHPHRDEKGRPQEHQEDARDEDHPSGPEPQSGPHGQQGSGEEPGHDDVGHPAATGRGWLEVLVHLWRQDPAPEAQRHDGEGDREDHVGEPPRELSTHLDEPDGARKLVEGQSQLELRVFPGEPVLERRAGPVLLARHEADDPVDRPGHPGPHLHALEGEVRLLVQVAPRGP